MAVQAILDGVDVTSITLEGSVTKRHNRPTTATVRLPSALTTGTDTSRLKVTLDGDLDFHGTVEHIEDDGDEDTMYTVFTAADPTLIFDARRARDADGDYTLPSFIRAFVTGPQIVEQIVANSITYEGPMGIQTGSFATGGADLSGAPTNWPMTLAEVIVLLTETGELDVVATPIDVGGNMAELSAYNGDYGSNLSGTVSFEYAAGSRNAIKCRRTIDKSRLCNKLRYLLGPRTTASGDIDKTDNQHWRGSVEATNLTLPNPPQATIDLAIAASRDDYFVRDDVRIFDGDVNVVRKLYERQWQVEAWLRLKPKTLVHITPQRGIKPAFTTGDLIGVVAGSGFRGGFAGVQRVMEYTYRWDADGVIELGEPVGMAGAAAVVTTGDQEGMT